MCVSTAAVATLLLDAVLGLPRG